MSDTTLKSHIQEQMKIAMKAKDKPRLSTIRLILAAVKQKEVDEQIQLDDAQTLAILDKMLKQRRDSFEQYTQANRHDLAEQEALEMEIIESFLPKQLSADEVHTIIEQAITQTQAASMQDMGKVMAQVRPQVQGRADMRMVSEQIKQRLS